MAIAKRLIRWINGLLFAQFIEDVFIVCFSELVSVINHGFRPDNIIQNENTLDTSIKGLALKSAGIRDDFLCIFREMNRIGITYWLCKNDIGKSLLLHDPFCSLMIPWMNCIDGWRIQTVHCQKNFRQRRIAVCIFLTMAGHVVILIRDLHRITIKVKNARLFPRKICKMQEGIIHDVAYTKRSISKSFLLQLVQSILCRAEIQRSNVICCNPVDLFRTIQRAKAVTCFNMNNRYMKLYSCKCGSKCGVGISVDQQGIRLFFNQYLLDSHQHLCRHLRMGTAGNTEVIIRFRNAHLAEENCGHIVIEVLTCMDKDFLMILPKGS